MTRHEVSESFIHDLAEIVRGDVWADILHRAAFSTDASIYTIAPCCIVAPLDVNDIVATVKFAARQKIPVVARGAGSGVAGESLCSGIVFDMGRYMNKIISIADDGSTAVCEPGVVLDDLNNRLSEYGTKIGPDPSTSNRATVGGCVANNATGAHSLQFGYIGDYVEKIEAVLVDGTLVEFENNFQPGTGKSDKVDSIAQQCISILSANEDVIRKALPETKRNRSGYTIAEVCRNGKIDLAQMLAGSEGTLCIFTKITLRTVPIPPAKAVLQLEFDSLEKMAQAVPITVDTGASACELMDKSLIDMAIEALPQYRDILPAEAVVALFVEHTAQTQAEAEEKIKLTDSKVGNKAYNRRIILDAGEQKRLSKARKDAVPLLYRKKGKSKPIPFIEDVSVPNHRLAEYITGLQQISKRYDIEMSYYGHAGDGELHIRPYLDLSQPDEIKKMLSIANDVFSIAWSLGGSISGEHADGLVRAAFIKKQYGNEFYELMCSIKNIFDPDNLMNPGKIINEDPDIMTKNLRAQKKLLPERLKTDLFFEADELAAELEQCNGCGLCLSNEAELRMCPVFRAVGEELASSRAKANILRFWATGDLSEKDFKSPQFRKFLDLCVNCKACSLQCPSGVDTSKLMMAARALYVKQKGLRAAEALLSRNRYLSKLSSIFPPAANLSMKLPPFKWLLEKTVGLDKRRDMPRFKRSSFIKTARQYLKAAEPIKNPADKVAYFVDTYANYNDHELGFAVIDVLRHNNIEVILPDQRPAPLPAIYYGDAKRAKKDLSYSAKYLAQAIRDGYKVVCSEPSAAMCLQQELRHFVSGLDAQLVSKNTFELMNYLLDLFKQGKLKPTPNTINENFIYHTPCHLLPISTTRATVELLKGLSNINVVDLNAGCCGLAGTFGMQKKNYELSEEISRPLKEALDRSPTKYVLTECAACGMQIEHLSDCTVRHPIKILARAYGIAD